MLVEASRQDSNATLTANSLVHTTCGRFRRGLAQWKKDRIDAAAGDDDEAKLSEDKVTELQRWRRGCNVMWVSEMLRADGRTLRTRFAAGLWQRIWNYEVRGVVRAEWARPSAAWAPRTGTARGSRCLLG